MADGDGDWTGRLKMSKRVALFNVDDDQRERNSIKGYIALGTDELDMTNIVRVTFAFLIHRDVWRDSSLFPLEKIRR
jgi:hypothetical protein